ncbi:MAG: winged helix-turn-helix transcriptional regulator [Nocardioides sp.]
MDESQRYCPAFHRAVELIGRRWNGPIIRALLDGAERFGEIRSGIPGLTDRLLAQRLREFEREGVVARVAASPAATSVVPHYTLTAKGHSLAPVIDAIDQWASQWRDGPDSDNPERGHRQPAAGAGELAVGRSAAVTG